MSPELPNDHLRKWMTFLEGYADNWDECFTAEFGDKFFTQEYWYLFVNVTRACWDMKPLHLSAAKRQIRGLANCDDQTKTKRIQDAQKAGLIDTITYQECRKRFPTFVEKDKRKTFVIPTPALEDILRKHFSTTLKDVITFVKKLHP